MPHLVSKPIFRRAGKWALLQMLASLVILQLSACSQVIQFPTPTSTPRPPTATRPSRPTPTASYTPTERGTPPTLLPSRPRGTLLP